MGFRELNGLRPRDREPVEKLLNPLELRAVAAAHEEFHRNNPWNSKSLDSGLFEPFLRRFCSSKTVDQNIGVNEDHLRRPLPSFRAELARKLNAVYDVRSITPHSKAIGLLE